MARVNQRSAINAISIENTAIGEYLDDGALFRKFPADPKGPFMPTRTKVPDNMVGSGSPYPKQSKPYYYNPVNEPYAGALTDTIGARILRLWNGGTNNAVAVVGATGVSDNTVEMLDAGDAPLTVNLIRADGGARFLLGDVAVQTVEVSQDMSNEPRISATFFNGGHFATIGDTNIDTADVEAMEAYKKFDGKKTRLTFSDGVDTFDFAGEKRLISVTFTGNQNVKADQLPGDSPVDATNECRGGFTQNLSIGVQQASMRVKVFMDADFDEFASWQADRKLTSVSLVFKTCDKIGTGTPVYTELEIKFPIGEFNLEPDTQGDEQAFAFVIDAIEGDAVTGSLVKIRARILGNIDETLP